MRIEFVRASYLDKRFGRKGRSERGNVRFGFVGVQKLSANNGKWKNLSGKFILKRITILSTLARCVVLGF